MRQTLIYGLFTFALAQASPTRKEPSPIIQRDDSPKPSHCPGQESAECANEPLYFNFDVTKTSDSKRVERLHKAFCNEFNVLTIAGSTATRDNDRTIYQRFFPESDAEDDYKSRVDDIWNKLFDFGAQTPSALVATFIFDNKDWQKRCGETSGADLQTNSESLEIAAYTAVDPTDSREKTHFCVTALEYLDLASISCKTLDSYPSVQMDSTGRIMLHEFSHYSTVGPDSLLHSQIGDSKNEDDLYAYGASRTHGLIDPKQDDQPEKCMINADNYAWMSTNSFFKQACKNVGQQGPNNGNFNDPPNYIENRPGDPSTTGHGDNSGDNGCGSLVAPGCNGTPGGDDTYGVVAG